MDVVQSLINIYWYFTTRIWIWKFLCGHLKSCARWRLVNNIREESFDDLGGYTIAVVRPESRGAIHWNVSIFLSHFDSIAVRDTFKFSKTYIFISFSQNLTNFQNKISGPRPNLTRRRQRSIWYLWTNYNSPDWQSRHSYWLDKRW